MYEIHMKFIVTIMKILQINIASLFKCYMLILYCSNSKFEYLTFQIFYKQTIQKRFQFKRTVLK